MRICIVGPYPPFRGGIAQFNYYLAKQLQLRGHHTIIINFKKQYPKLLFPGEKQLTNDAETSDDIESYRVLTPYDPFSFRQSFEKIKRNRPDIVIFAYWIPFMAPAYTWIAKRLKKKSITTAALLHNIQFHEKWPAGNYLSHSFLKQIDLIITLSDTVKRDVSCLISGKQMINAFHPLYKSFDNKRYDALSAKKELGLEKKEVLLFFGFIKPYKGLDILIEAFAKLSKEIENLHLLIVGEVYGSDRSYDEMITRYGLEDKCTFVKEFVPDNQIEKYFKAAKILVLPYRHATQSGVLQIAYSMKLGVVVTPVGSLPDMVDKGKTGMVAADTTPESLSEAIKSCLEIADDVIKKKIENKNKQYGWDSFVELLEVGIKKTALQLTK
jgi:glycosyltransferase involved in cell wall biosynthesis